MLRKVICELFRSWPPSGRLTLPGERVSPKIASGEAHWSPSPSPSSSPSPSPEGVSPKIASGEAHWSQIYSDERRAFL